MQVEGQRIDEAAVLPCMTTHRNIHVRIVVCYHLSHGVNRYNKFGYSVDSFKAVERLRLLPYQPSSFPRDLGSESRPDISENIAPLNRTFGQRMTVNYDNGTTFLLA